VPAGVEPALLIFLMNRQRVALHFDDRMREQLLRAIGGDRWIGASANFDVVRPGNLDLLERADLIVAGYARASVLAAVVAASRGCGGCGGNGRGCAWVLLSYCVI
jgi:hypothetical protein